MTPEEIDALVGYIGELEARIDALEAEIVDLDVKNDDLQRRLDFTSLMNGRRRPPPRLNHTEAELRAPDGSRRQLNHDGHPQKTAQGVQDISRGFAPVPRITRS